MYHMTAHSTPIGTGTNELETEFAIGCYGEADISSDGVAVSRVWESLK